MAEPPLFSVIIPVHNAERWLAEAIDSALAQGRNDVEIIAIDDGSTDGSPAVLERYRGRVRTIRQDNAGPSAARNRGIEAAAGPWIAFLDADDRYRPGHLDRLAAAIAARPDAGLIYTDALIIDEHGQARKRKSSPDPGPEPLLSLLLANTVTTSAAAVRREALARTGLFFTGVTCGEDWDLWLRIARLFPVIHLPAIGIDYRRQDRGLVHTRGLAMRNDNLAVLARALELAPEIPPAVRRRAYANAYYESGMRLLAAGEAAAARREFIAALGHTPAAPRLWALAALTLAGRRAAETAVAWSRAREAVPADGRLRLTHLITDSGAGGAEKILNELATRLDREFYDVRVVVIKREGVTAARLRAAGIPVTSLDLPARPGLGYVLRLPLAATRLAGILGRSRPHVLHCWLFQANLLGRLAARLTGVPVNISSLRVLEREHPGQYRIDRATRGWVSHYVAVSEEVAVHARAAMHLPPERITVIANGIDPAPLAAADPNALRRELGVPDQVPVIGALGRLHRQKGLDVLLRALPALLARFPELVLLIGGDGPEATALQGLAHSLGIASQVRFLGAWRRVPEFMAALDLLVLPSRWEGMPNVVLEAMAAARPVCASDLGGVREIVTAGGLDGPRSGETGLLVRPDDPAALARAIGALLGDPARRQTMGRAGRARVELGFRLDRMVSRYQSLYLDLLRRRI
jgi:glycosyltransferase involved in cell wall biosynthesis